MTRTPVIVACVAVVSLLPANTALRAQVQKAVGSAVQRQIRNIENALVEFPPGATARGQETAQQVTLAERMAALHVPGVSVAVINDGAIEWAKGYGLVKAGEPARVTPDTIFEAASTTKLVATVIALRLVEQGALSLDEDVNARLKSWKVPESDLTTVQKVTLRRLLTHQAGINRPDGGIGFTPGRVPTLVQVLKGAEPAENKPAVVESVPGSKWAYSNFDFLVIQLLIEEAVGKPFAQAAREMVFQPLDMTSSTLSHPVDATLRRRTIVPHDENGRAHDRPMHPTALAQGGLLTTPSDLGRLAIELMRATQGQSNRVLSRKTVLAMMKQEVALDPNQFGGFVSGQGLGTFLMGQGQNLAFLHPGSNVPGATCLLIGFPALGKGAIIMTNAAGGELLMAQLALTIQREYRWPLGQ